MPGFPDGSVRPSRRRFIQGSSAALAAASLTSLAPRVHAAGDETLKIALVGCGNRGTGAASNALQTAGPVKLWAMADAFADRLQGSLQILQNGGRASAAPCRRRLPSASTWRRAAIRRARCLSACHRRGRRGVALPAAGFPARAFRIRRGAEQARVHGKARGHRRARRAAHSGGRPGRGKQGAQSRRRLAATSRREVSGDGPPAARRCHRRTANAALLLERRHDQAARGSRRSHRARVPGAQLVLLLVAQRRPHRRAACTQPGRGQLAHGRSSGQSLGHRRPADARGQGLWRHLRPSCRGIHVSQRHNDVRLLPPDARLRTAGRRACHRHARHVGRRRGTNPDDRRRVALPARRGAARSRPRATRTRSSTTPCSPLFAMAAPTTRPSGAPPPR